MNTYCLNREESSVSEEEAKAANLDDGDLSGKFMHCNEEATR